MRDWTSQSHVRGYGKYHVVFVPKYRRKALYRSLRRKIGRVFRKHCEQHGVEIDFSRPSKPTGNAWIESFNGRLRQECLNAH